MTTPTVVLPTIIVEAALTAGQPVSGPGTLTLNDATFGLLDTDWLATFDAWTDISAYVLGFTITRPSTRQEGPLWQFQAGTISIALDNSDGRFDPANTSGPYVSGGVSQVHAMVPVRVRIQFSGSEHPMFKGFADSWTETAADYDQGYSEWTLNATDGFKILAGRTLPAAGSSVGASELTGARVGRILDAASWYTGQGAGARHVDTGKSALQATSYGDSALSLLQLAVDSEIGQLYVDGAGTVVFRDHGALLADTRSTTSQATFGDLPGGGYTGTYSYTYPGNELPYATLTRACDDTVIANDVQATNVGGLLQEVTDTASYQTYLFWRTYARSDLILTSDAAALNWAAWVLYVSKSGEDRFDSVTVDPAADPANLWPQVLGREIGDRITVIRRPQNSGIQITRDVFITGITHTFDPGAQAPNPMWLTTWQLADASKYAAFLKLDDATLGKLGSNALSF